MTSISQPPENIIQDVLGDIQIANLRENPLNAN